MRRFWIQHSYSLQPCSVKTRDVESKDFLLDSQLPTLNPQNCQGFGLPTPNYQAPKITEISNSQLHISESIFHLTPNSQFTVPKIVRDSNSQLPSPKNRQTPNSHVSTPNSNFTSLVRTIVIKASTMRVGQVRLTYFIFNLA